MVNTDNILKRFVKWGINLNIKKRFSSIKAKTLLYLIVFSVSILLVLWFCQIVFLKYSYQDYQIQNINQLALSIQRSSFVNLNSTLEEVAYENEVCIEYYTNSGNVYYYNTMMNGCALGKNNQDILKTENAFMESNLTSDTYKVINREYEVQAFLYGIKLDSGSVFLYSTLEDVGGANAVLKNQLIYLTFIAIIFACMIAYFLSKKITDPILDITKKAQKLGSSPTVKFPDYGVLEVNELAHVLSNAQTEMVKTDELRRDLMANVSHDLKTPLTMIKAYAEMVRDISYQDEQKRTEHCNIIMDEVERLNVLVNDILTLSKMQANADEIHLESFDLVKEIETIVKRYEIIKETENYHFVLDLPTKAMVYADQKKLNQVIYNLINNAINYTGSDKTVTVRVKKEKDSYLVEIIDTGKGIKKEEIDLIWDKYYKNDKNHQRNVVGTGLGLSIVKTILENHHFKYGVKSEKNKGTTFYFYVKKK